jgi:hypothetical protein
MLRAGKGLRALHRRNGCATRAITGDAANGAVFRACCAGGLPAMPVQLAILRREINRHVCNVGPGCFLRRMFDENLFIPEGTHECSAFHELTSKAICGILPLDLSPSWQEKRGTKPSYCHCLTTVQRNFGFSVWIAATLASLARHTQYLNSRSLGNAWASRSGVSWHHLLNLVGQSAKTTPTRSV